MVECNVSVKWGDNPQPGSLYGGSARERSTKTIRINLRNVSFGSVFCVTLGFTSPPNPTQWS